MAQDDSLNINNIKNTLQKQEVNGKQILEKLTCKLHKFHDVEVEMVY